MKINNGITRGVVTATIAGSFLAIGSGLYVACQDIAVAQSEQEGMKEELAEQRAAIKKIPAIETDIGHIQESIESIDTTLQDIADVLKNDAVEDAKYHHKHRGNP